RAQMARGRRCWRFADRAVGRVHQFPVEAVQEVIARQSVEHAPTVLQLPEVAVKYHQQATEQRACWVLLNRPPNCCLHLAESCLFARDSERLHSKEHRGIPPDRALAEPARRTTQPRGLIEVSFEQA